MWIYFYSCYLVQKFMFGIITGNFPVIISLNIAAFLFPLFSPFVTPMIYVLGLHLFFVSLNLSFILSICICAAFYVIFSDQYSSSIILSSSVFNLSISVFNFKGYVLMPKSSFCFFFKFA